MAYVKQLLLLVLADWCTMSVRSSLTIHFFGCHLDHFLVQLQLPLFISRQASEKEQSSMFCMTVTVIYMVAPIVRDNSFVLRDIARPSSMLHESDVMNPGVITVGHWGSVSLNSHGLQCPIAAFQSVADLGFEQHLEETPSGSLDWTLPSCNSSHGFHCKNRSSSTNKQLCWHVSNPGGRLCVFFAALYFFFFVRLHKQASTFFIAH